MAAAAIVQPAGVDLLAPVRISDASRARWNLPPAILTEYALRRQEGKLASTGALAVETGKHTGRSPHDKFVVRERVSAGKIWWGEINQPMPADHFDALWTEVASYLSGRELFVEDLCAGADPTYRIGVRVISESAWSALFARNLFIVPGDEEAAAGLDQAPEFTILHAPKLRLDPVKMHTHSETAIVVSFAHRLILIAGTRYAGEIKKSIFGVLQYLLPQQDVATMHCSANAGTNGETALFFGLSGTGKTTLSTDPSRILIGDDEHGWSDRGIFNFEGGSYAKVINLNPETEPEIAAATHRFGTILENVVLDPASREPLTDDDTLTENTRAAFPLSYIPNSSPTGQGDHPRHIVLLTADAFGVLPPVARLTPEQAIYYYLSGYTSKLAGTEVGIDEPEATFSACFGAPFLHLPPVRYGELLAERIARHKPDLWLVNTGWTGGRYGTGKRISLPNTRAIVRAILENKLAAVETEPEPAFGLAVPVSCPDVPSAILQPRTTWTDPDAYDRTARILADRFAKNFAQFAHDVPPAVAEAGPR